MKSINNSASLQLSLDDYALVLTDISIQLNTSILYGKLLSHGQTIT